MVVVAAVEREQELAVVVVEVAAVVAEGADGERVKIIITKFKTR